MLCCVPVALLLSGGHHYPDAVFRSFYICALAERTNFRDQECLNKPRYIRFGALDKSMMTGCWYFVLA